MTSKLCVCLVMSVKTNRKVNPSTTVCMRPITDIKRTIIRLTKQTTKTLFESSLEN